MDFTANLESSYEALCKSYSTFTYLLYKCYVDLKRSEEYSDLPESTSFIIGSLSAAYYEIRTSKDLIERVINPTISNINIKVARKTINQIMAVQDE